eukprot:7524367-Pyramimonas_sp.AAC.1
MFSMCALSASTALTPAQEAPKTAPKPPQEAPKRPPKRPRRAPRLMMAAASSRRDMEVLLESVVKSVRTVCRPRRSG